MGDSGIFKASLSRAMALCSKREYCRDDIYSKLQQWGAGENDCNKILRALVSEKFIDELRYSKAFAKDKFSYNKWGRIKIAANLRIKKIPPEIIKEALASIDNDKYLQILNDLISSHRKRIKARNQYELKGKLMRFALAKGFESGLIYDLLNDT
jgi:regulatory protein